MSSENETQIMEDNPTDRELLWRQYNLWLDLYKFHLDLVLKANAFFYLITGGILTFILLILRKSLLDGLCFFPFLWV